MSVCVCADRWEIRGDSEQQKKVQKLTVVKRMNGGGNFAMQYEVMCVRCWSFVLECVK